MSASQEIRYFARLSMIGVLVLATPFAVGLAIAQSLSVAEIGVTPDVAQQGIPTESDVVDTPAVPLN